MSVGAAAQSTRTEEELCERGDRRACHRLGRGALTDGGAREVTKAWLWLGRACELGEADACDDAARLATTMGRAMAADSFEEDARRWRRVGTGPYVPPDAGPTVEQECDSGNAKACRRLGLAAAAVADAGPAETKRARALLMKACKLGDRAACAEQQALADADPEEDVPPPTADAGVDAGPPPIAIAEADGVDAGPPEEAVPIPPPLSLARPEEAPKKQPKPPPPFDNTCLAESEIERYRTVLATKDDPTAFRPSGIWALPFYLTNAERSYTWAALLYFQSLDFEEGTRTRIVPPFFASHCAPDSQTLLTPFYSYRTDAEGTAALYFTYFRRRDRLIETDVLFPLAYSFRERATEDDPWVGSGAFLPFAFWKRDPSGAQFTIVPPFFWRWGDDETTTTLVGNTYYREAADRFDLGVVPLYFRGRGARGGDYDISPALFWSFRDGPKSTLVLPLLLTVFSGDADTKTLWSFNTYYQSRPNGAFTFAFAPLLFVGREGGKHHTFLPPLFWRWGDDTEGSSTTIAGNVYWHETKLRKDLGIVPLYFHGSSIRDGEYDISPLLFWSFRDGKKHTLFLPPVLAYHQSDGETSTTFAINTYYQSRPTGHSLAVFPFLFKGREGNDRHFMVPPLFWMWGDEEETTTIVANVFWHKSKKGTDLGVVPLYFRGRSADGTADYDVSPLLFWSFRDGRKHSLFLPPLLTFHTSEGETSTTWAANTYVQLRPNGFTLNFVPLLFAGREGEDHHVVVPPLFAHWGGNGEETTIAANVFWHTAKTRTDFGIVPLYFHGHTATTAYDISPLLFWSFRDGPKHSLLMPALLAYHQTDGETSTTWAINTYFQTRPYGFTLNSFPFLFLGQDGDAHHTVIPGLFARWGDKEETTTIAGPVYWHEEGGRKHFGLPPLYFGGRSTAGEFDVSPFLFWSFREGLKHRLFIPPLLAFHESDGVTSSTWALNTWFQKRPTGFTLNSIPFLFMKREGEEHHTVVPPLFFRWGDAQTATTIAGPVFWRTTPERTDFGIVPLYFHGPGYDVSPLLFWSFRKGPQHSLLIPPLLTWHDSDGETSTTFAVQTYVQTRPYGFTLNSFPFLFMGQDGDAHHTFVPPVFWRWGDKETTTTIAANVYWRTTPERTDFGIVPLYFHGPGYDVSPPLFWSFRDGAQRTLLIPPLLTFHTTDGETDTTWSINTYYQSRPYGFTLNSFPFLFMGQDGDAHHTVIPGLFARWGDTEESTTIVANGFFHWTPKRWDFGLIPLFFSGRGEKGAYDIAPLLFWSFRDGANQSLLIPPLLTYYETDGENETAWVLQTYFASRAFGYTLNSFPFLFAGQDGDAFHTFLPPLFWDWGDLKERTTIAGPAYFHWTPTESKFGLAPIYLGKRGVDGDYDLVPPLFWSYRQGRNWSLLLPAILTYASVQDETQTLWIANTYFQSRPNGFTLNVIPFLFTKEEGERHHTFMPPLFWRWGNKNEKTTIVGNIFWHWEPDRTDWGIVPLFFHGESARNGIYNVSPLLFWSFLDGPKHSLFIPPLLAFYESRPTGFTLASPLLFIGREGADHHTILPPLIWRWGDAETTTTIVGPAFNRSTPTGSTFGLAPLFFGGNDNQGNAWQLVPPLLLYRSSSPEGQHILMPPFFDYRSTPTSKLFLSPIAVYSKEPEHERTVIAGIYWNMSGPDLEARVLAPLWWDFKSKKKGTRLSTVFPLYWRYEKPEEVTHLFLNIMYSYGETALGKSWSFHLFPLIDLVSYHPKHFLWQIFAGLFGRETQADSSAWKIGWTLLEPTKREPPVTK